MPPPSASELPAGGPAGWPEVVGFLDEERSLPSRRRGGFLFSAKNRYHPLWRAEHPASNSQAEGGGMGIFTTTYSSCHESVPPVRFTFREQMFVFVCE